MWKSVVNSINLSEQQKLNIVQWKQLFMQKVSNPCIFEFHSKIFNIYSNLCTGLTARSPSGCVMRLVVGVCS